MEEANLINNLSSYVLILINVGCLTRIIYCIVIINTNNELKDKMKQRIRNIIIFLIIANSLISIRQAANLYWG